MHIIGVLQLHVADSIVYEDETDPDSEKMIVTKGIEGILKIKEEKETDSIGFDFYATTITVNKDLEIEKIHQNYDVAQ